MPGAVLTDIQHGQVKAKDLDLADYRVHLGRRQSIRPHREQRPPHHAQIQNQILRLVVPLRPREQMNPHEQDRLPPGLLPVDAHFGFFLRADPPAPLRQPLFQLGGDPVIFPRERQMGSQPLQPRTDQLQRRRAVKNQALGRHLRGDQRMPVAISPHPRAESQRGPHRRMGGSSRSESRDLPGVPQPPVGLRNRARHGSGQTVNDPLALHVHRRSLGPHLFRPPPALQHRLEMIPAFPLRAVAPRAAAAFQHDPVDLLHAGEDGPAPRLGGMSRQHRLHAEQRQNTRQVIRRLPRTLQPTQGLGPGARLVLRPVDGLAQLAHRGGRHLLREVEQAEGNRVSPGDFALLDLRQMFRAVDPGQNLPHLLLSQLLQQLPENSHHPGEIPLHPGKAPLQPLLVRQLRLAEFGPGTAFLAVRGHAGLRC